MAPEVVQLCTYCSDLIPLQETPEKRPHHGTIALLLQSSKQCKLCKAIASTFTLEEAHYWVNLRDIDQSGYESMELTMGIKDAQHEVAGLSWALLDCTFVHEPKKFGVVKVLSVTTCRSDATAAELPIWQEFPTVTDDKISTAKTWLQECKSNHPECTPSKGKLPKRLVEIGIPNERPPRLVASKDLKTQDVRFASLSYCWGTSHHLVTTRETLAELSKEIPFQKIPRTFQDAMKFAYDLDIPYIWIDALCIAQNDMVEWENEAAAMQNVYSGSVVTIAATDAVDSSGGCFVQNSLDTEADNINGTAAIAQSTFFSTRNPEADELVLVRTQISDSRTIVDKAPLNKRGWTLQEMVLSHRTIHCTRSELHWQCRSALRTETGVTHSRQMVQHGALPPLLPNGTNQNEIWWMWMQSYSERKLSFASDKLAAVWGIARYYQQVTGDTPFLGTWASTLVQDLLWIRTGQIELPISIAKNMPTWSCFSCPGSVMYDIHRLPGRQRLLTDIVKTAEVVDWRYFFLNKGTLYGMESKLILDGPVREIKLSISDAESGDGSHSFIVDDEILDYEKSLRPSRSGGMFDREDRRPPALYLCLLIQTGLHEDKDTIRETFLMLEESPDHPAGTAYRRAGLGFIWGTERYFDLTVRRTLELV